MKKSNWVIFLVNGLIAILFGVLALFLRDHMVRLTMYFGGLLAIGGIVLFFISLNNMNKNKPNLLLMFEAILAVLVGAVIMFYPGMTLQFFFIAVGIWASVMGLLQIIIAVQMKKKVSHHEVFTINGVITLIFGLLLLFKPITTMTVLFTIIGVLAMIAGLLLVYLSLKIRGMSS